MKRRVGGKFNDVYRTPREVYEPLHRLLKFSLDCAASRSNALCRRFYSERENGLLQPWNAPTWWCNPPYGRKDNGTGEWVWKGRREVEARGNRGCLLIPVKSETEWYSRGVFGDNRVTDSGRLSVNRKLGGRWYRLLDRGTTELVSPYFVEVLELDGRLAFEAGQNGWFASAVVVFNAGRVPLLPQLEALRECPDLR